MTATNPAMNGERSVIDLDIDAPPYSRNPSAWSQRVPIVVLAGLGFLISTYLGLYQWRLIPTAWDPIFGDGTMRVLDSDVSHQMKEWIGVPDAILGALAYLGDGIYGLAGSTRRWQLRPWMVILFGLDVIPLGIVSVILVFAQGLLVGHWCFFCLVTAVISLVLVGLAYDEVWACLKYLARVWSTTHSVRALWDAFCGRPTDQVEQIALSKEVYA